MSDHRSSVIHSSYAQLPATETVSPDTRAPAIGIIVRSHDTPHKTTISVLVSMPRLTSIELGETFLLDTGTEMFCEDRQTNVEFRSEVETLVRQKALEIETRCRVLAAELLKHADRMKMFATRSKLIDDVPTPVNVSERYIPATMEPVRVSVSSPSSSPSLPPSLLSKLSRR